MFFSIHNSAQRVLCADNSYILIYFVYAFEYGAYLRFDIRHIDVAVISEILFSEILFGGIRGGGGSFSVLWRGILIKLAQKHTPFLVYRLYRSKVLLAEPCKGILQP